MFEEIVGVIVASGKGQRLSSITNGLPKALAPIGSKPILLHTINRFKKADIKTVYLIVRYNILDFKDFITEYQSLMEINIKLIELNEETFMDSPINDILLSIQKSYLPNLPNYLITYCDVITNFKVKDLIDLHQKNKAHATMLLFKGNPQVFIHKYMVNSSGIITSISADSKNDDLYANAGIYILNRQLFEGYSIEEKIFFSEFGGPIEKAYNILSLSGISTANYFFREIGIVNDFLQCTRELSSQPTLFNELFY